MNIHDLPIHSQCSKNLALLNIGFFSKYKVKVESNHRFKPFGLSICITILIMVVGYQTYFGKITFFLSG